MRDRRKSILALLDWPVIVCWLLLLAVGWLSVCGASYDFDHSGSSLDFSTRSGMQLVWIGTSVVLAALILCIDETLYSTFAYVFYGLLMLLLAATPLLAHDIKGSLSWIKVGTFSVQPAEFAKFATALCLGRFIARHGFTMKRRSHLLATWGIVLLPMLLIVLQRETGSALVYAAFFVVLYREGMPGAILFSGLAAVVYFVVGVRWGDAGRLAVLSMAYLFTVGMMWVYEGKPSGFARAFIIYICVLPAGWAVSSLTGAFTPAAVVLALVVGLALWLTWQSLARQRASYLLMAVFALASVGFHYSCDLVMDDVLQEHQQKRVRVLLGMEDDPRGAGYNVIQAKIAIGSGGLRGKGFLNGTQTKLRYVPEQETDFIFCTVGEEQGFAGCAATLLLFLTLILRLTAIAERQTDRAARVYGYSVASLILFHVFINVGMVLGLTPVIGIPLPFISYGGSSMWAFTILLFILLRTDAADKRLRR